ncbi:MAG TPA: hypothetical protein VGM59_16020, partial [Dongiaceae bacterium]
AICGEAMVWNRSVDNLGALCGCRGGDQAEIRRPSPAALSQPVENHAQFRCENRHVSPYILSMVAISPSRQS